jgi:hypothetical protein
LLFCCNAQSGRPKIEILDDSAGRRGDSAMARTYRDIAIEEMLGTVEEAMSQPIDWWGDLRVDERSDRAVSHPTRGGN